MITSSDRSIKTRKCASALVNRRSAASSTRTAQLLLCPPLQDDLAEHEQLRFVKIGHLATLITLTSTIPQLLSDCRVQVCSAASTLLATTRSARTTLSRYTDEKGTRLKVDSCQHVGR